ncbi:MAG: CDP-diacylglycerol--glycerol-3-phosphate 3-phosphatidyltransferase [Clostridia bacterium]|nr:CDP-diacylglycerol--glycerol-3-phosphate 3-phosphatidyltransferase [Clostridia bacterium]
MSTPNKLTVLRVLFIPVFMAFSLYDFAPYSNYISLGIFVLAFITDALDGYLARKTGQITDFGKIMDPLADKLLVTAALVCLLQQGIVSSWVVVIILAREFIISGIRIVAAADGNVIAASWWGKWKTVSQFIAVSVALFFDEANAAVDIIVWFTAILTLISGVDYIAKNAKYMSMK